MRLYRIVPSGEDVMRIFLRFLVVFALVFCGDKLRGAQLEQSPRGLIHLLDYLATDYGGAVDRGKILDQNEYAEQKEFAEMASEIGATLSKDAKYSLVHGDLNSLHKMIASLADASLVSAKAIAIKNEVIRISGIPISPMSWPNIQNGKTLFEGRCGSCHGASGAGDGPAGAHLDPKPRNLLDDSHMRGLSAFHIFNVIRLGIPGTGMVAALDLSEKDVWDLSFYVLSIRAKEPLHPTTEVPLDQVASLSDVELLQKFSGDDETKKKYVAALRLKSGGDSGSSLGEARTGLDKSFEAYRDGKKDEAKKIAVAAYLEGVEPIEPKLRSVNPGLTSELEHAMADFRSVIGKQGSLQELEEKMAKAKIEISRAETALESKQNSFWMTFSMAAGIVFREGFEAILVILAILGVIRGASAKRAAKYVHGGWALAIFLGVAAWFFSGWMLMVSGAQRELSEGIASLFAVVVLLYMGFWLHSKTEIRRWTAFINGRVRAALEGSSRWGLFALSFIAVFREALETVLFMRALTLEGDRASEFAMFSGVAFSFAAIFLMAWAFFRFSVDLPVRRLFAISSGIMVGLSIILIGKGLHSFQEVGMLSITSISLPFELPVMGVFSTFETLSAQLATIVACLVIWLVMSRSTVSTGSRRETA